MPPSPVPSRRSSLETRLPFPSPSLKTAQPIKRRHREIDDEAADNTEVAPLKKQKSAKRKKPKKQNRGDDESLDLENGLNLAIGRMSSQLLADHVAQRMIRFEENLSALEVADRCIPGNEPLGD